MVGRRHSTREIAAWTAVALLVLAVILFYLWHLNENVRLGWENSKLENERTALQTEIRRLEARQSALLAPDRVERIAKSSLKLVEPRDEQIIYEER